MIVTNTSAFAPEAPAIDVSEARWASEELAALIARLGPDSPVRMVLRQTASLAGFGAVAGLAGAFVLLQILGSTVRLKAVSLIDGMAFAAGLALVAAAAGVAAYQPARRAARVDPAQTLRAD